MKHIKTKLTLASLALGIAAVCALAQSTGETSTTSAASEPPDAANLRTFIELVRSDLKTQKAIVIAENLPMAEEEAAEFWPLHREYEAELSKLNDQKLALIARYANLHNTGTITDQQATALAKESFAYETKRTDLKRKYFKKFTKVIPATKAARFFQIENQINLALDLRVAASLPLIK